MIDVFSWGWPQWILIVIVCVDLCQHGAMNGKPRKPYNAAFKMVDAIIFVVLLLFGGFFN